MSFFGSLFFLFAPNAEPSLGIPCEERYCLVDLDAPAPAFCADQLRQRLPAAEVRQLTGCHGSVKLLFIPESADLRVASSPQINGWPGRKEAQKEKKAKEHA